MTVEDRKQAVAEQEAERVADVTVIILAYSMERWALTCASVESVLAQTLSPREIIMCIDENPELSERLTERWRGRTARVPAIRIVDSRRDGGRPTPAAGPNGRRSSHASHGSHIASGRTTGVELASTELVAFLDDDAAADPDWLERLIEPLEDPSVAAVGGAPLPVYGKPRPRWFPREFDWVFGCAYAGLPTRRAPVLRLIGANMAARRKDLLAIGGLHSMADDLDMCHRLLELSPQNELIYEPAAIVRHHVHADRLTFHYFWWRCFWVNREKVAIMRDLGEAANLKADRRFVQRTLSVGVARGLRELLRGDVGGLQRALAIVLGVGVAGIAYLTGTVEWNVAHRRGRESASAR
jgi:glucosyl-dolichyl phosphate glucuronosyltransferase